MFSARPVRFIFLELTVYFSISQKVRGYRPGKSVQMTEQEVRGLCLKSREIFLQQPILLELEAPLIICGMYQFVYTKTSAQYVNITMKLV